jgi:NAD(P)-dependent dehydrogenase (short-subunit alcohol dehydrogenase family)
MAGGGSSMPGCGLKARAALAPHRIRVNGLLPTVMRTDSTAKIPDLRISSAPLGRLVEPGEVARGAVFLQATRQNL